MANVSFMREKQRLTARLDGEIDHHSAQVLREMIDAEVLMMTPLHLVLDFSGVTFMDSSGIGLILGRNTMMKVLGGSLKIAQPPRQILRILKLAQIPVDLENEEVKTR